MHRRAGEVIAQEGATSPYPLDETDRAIINLLSINSRLPLALIARTIGRSTEVVNYHYTQLRKHNVITDTFAVIDPRLLGIKRYTIYLQFHALAPDKMHSIVSRFLANKHLCWLIESGGKWELLLMIETLHEERLDELLETVMFPIRKYLNDYTVGLVRNFIHRGPRYVQLEHDRNLLKEEAKFPYFEELHAPKTILRELDARDIRLLKALHDDARVSLSELGTLVGLSPDAVNYRVKQLIRGAFIKGFIIRLNYHLLGFQYTSILVKLRNVSRKRRDEFLSHVYSNERFYSTVEQIGEWDISFLMYFISAKDLRDFLMAMKERFSDVIHSYETALHFDQHYFTYLCSGVIEELLVKYPL